MVLAWLQLFVLKEEYSKMVFVNVRQVFIGTEHLALVVLILIALYVLRAVALHVLMDIILQEIHVFSV